MNKELDIPSVRKSMTWLIAGSTNVFPINFDVFAQQNVYVNLNVHGLSVIDQVDDARAILISPMLSYQATNLLVKSHF